MEWALELINGYKKRRRARDQHRPQQRATSSCRSSTPTASRPRATPARSPARRRPRRDRRRHRLPRRRRRDRRRVPAQELPPARRLRGRQLHDLGRPGRERRRPEPQLRRPLGRPGRRHQPARPDLPRPRPVLRARDAQRPGARLPQPGDDADHQPHDGRPRAARARPGRARRPGRREPRLQGARRRDGQGERLLQPEVASSSTTRRARPRTGATTPPAASASRSRSTAAPRTTTTGDCDDPAFHPRYQRVVKEWDGTNPMADHTNDPGPNKGYDGKGNREAYYIAAESTLNEQRHSVLEGSVPPGTTLRLTKTSRPRPSRSRSPTARAAARVRRQARDGLRRRRRRRVRWHVNPSTRPIVAKETGKAEPRPAEPARDAQRRPGRRRRTTRSTTARAPGGDANANNPLNYNDHPITVPAGGDNESMQRQGRLGDAGQRLRRQALRGHQRRRPLAGLASPSSARARTARPARRPSPPSRPGLQAGKKYVLRVNNFAAVEPYTVTITYVAPQPFKPAQVESYTLTCERGGRVFDTQQVADRPRPGQAARPEGVRGRDPAGVRGQHDRAALGQGDPQGLAACASASSASRGRPVQIDVFQVSRGSRVIDERLVERFKARSKAVTWNGRGARGDGLYFARYRMKTRNGKGTEVRRVTLLRRNGRFSRRPDFYRRATCDLLPSYKLERAAFGGTHAHAAADRLPRRRPGARAGDRAARQEGRQALQGPHRRRPKRTHRLKLAARASSPGGDYRVRITVGRGSGPRRLHAGQPPALSGAAPRRRQASRRSRPHTKHKIKYNIK